MIKDVDPLACADTQKTPRINDSTMIKELLVHFSHSFWIIWNKILIKCSIYHFLSCVDKLQSISPFRGEENRITFEKGRNIMWLLDCKESSVNAKYLRNNDFHDNKIICQFAIVEMSSCCFLFFSLIQLRDRWENNFHRCWQTSNDFSV